MVILIIGLVLAIALAVWFAAYLDRVVKRRYRAAETAGADGSDGGQQAAGGQP